MGEVNKVDDQRPPIQVYIHEAQPVGALLEYGKSVNAPVKRLTALCDLGYDGVMCQTITYADGTHDIRFDSAGATAVWAWLRGL